MGGEWREVTVEEIKAQCENALATGPFGSSIGSRFFTDSGVPVIRGSNLSENIETRLNDQGLVFLSPEKAREFRRSMVHDGDLVFTCWGTVNQVGLVDQRAAHREYIISNKQMKLTPDAAKADSLFLYYVFSSAELQHRIKNQSIGSSVPGFNLGQLRAMRIRVPEVEEQRAIAQVLGTLDDKIEVNRRMNETLEAMARALFKSWFVDFDPVHAKTEDRDPGLPPPLADLFPDRLENSDMGEMPAGWRIGSVDDEFNLTMGQSPPGETYNEMGEGIPFYQGRADFGFRFPSHRVFCTAPTRYADTGDTLVSVRAPVGDVNMAAERCCIGRGVAAGRHKSGSRSYTYYFMHAIEEVFHRFEAEGTVFGSISKQDFHNIRRIMSPAQVVNAFERLAAPIDDKIASNDRGSRTLATLRDVLLPKLISGNVRVNDTERFLK